MTFVSRADEDFYVEHGRSFYTRSGSMGLTPGHSSPAGVRYRTFDPDAAILRCFSCHSTGPLRLEPGSRVMPSETGVRCETCHGPGVAHAQSGGREVVANPSRMSAKEINDLCGACHRKTSDDEYTNWNEPWNVRHQPLYFAQSRCFLESAGKLSCFSCHPPHESVSRSAEQYSRKCVSCHAGVQHKTAVQDSCTSCHMPVVELNPHLRFANHWIGVYAPGEPLRPRSR